MISVASEMAFVINVYALHNFSHQVYDHDVAFVEGQQDESGHHASSGGVDDLDPYPVDLPLGCHPMGKDGTRVCSWLLQVSLTLSLLQMYALPVVIVLVASLISAQLIVRKVRTGDRGNERMRGSVWGTKRDASKREIAIDVSPCLVCSSVG